MTRCVPITALFLALTCFLTASNGATYTWDGDSTTPPDPNEGSGSWDTFSANWWDGATHSAWNNAGEDTAVIGIGTAIAGDILYEIAVDGAGVNAGGLVFASGANDGVNDNYRLSGGDITLTSSTGTPKIDIGSTFTIVPQIASNLQGTDIDVGFNGSGATYFFDGPANNWTGELHLVNGGTPISAGAIAFRHVGAISTAPGASITVDAGTAVDPRIEGGGTFTTPLTLNGFGYNADTVYGLRNGRGALQVQSTATNVTYEGPITLASKSSISAGTRFTISGVISGDSELVTTGSNTLVLTAANTYTGNTIMYRGTLDLDSASGPAIHQNGGNLEFPADLGSSTNTVRIFRDEQIGDTAVIFFNSGTSENQYVDLRGHTETIAGLSKTTGLNNGYVQNQSANTTGTLVIKVPEATTYSYDGSVRDGSGSGNGTLGVVKQGGGTQILAGINSYTGNTTVQEGTLSLTNPTLADGADVFISTSAILDLPHGFLDDIRYLYLDGIPQTPGLYGSTGLESAFFTGPGLVSVLELGPALGTPGDFNSDGKVDAADYVVWRDNQNSNNALPNDDNLGTPIDASHYDLWHANFGNASEAGGLGSSNLVPEPTALTLISFGLFMLVAHRSEVVLLRRGR